MTMLKPGAVEKDKTVIPIGKLQHFASFGQRFTEELAGRINRLAEAFNALPSDDRFHLYEDLIVRYDEDRFQQALAKIVSADDMAWWRDVENFGDRVVLRDYLLRHAYKLDGDNAVLIKKIDLIAAS